MNCAEYRPHHQGQLVAEFGGEDGGVNCTACAAAMVAVAALCGPKYAVRGFQIREASDEPTPNEDFPGLTLRQVRDALLEITGRRVVLTVIQGIKFKHLKSRLKRGEVAVLQVQRQAIIDHGFGFGKAFADTHAVAIGFDHGELWVDDSLTKKFFPTWEQVADFAAALKLEGGGTVGQGFAWAAFAPRAPRLEATHQIDFAPGAVWVYELRNGFIWDRQAKKVPSAIAEDCTAIQTFATHPFGPRKDMPAQDLVILMSGPRKGFGIRPNASSVSIAAVSDDGPEPAAAREPTPVPSRIDLTSPDVTETPQFDEVVSDAELEDLEREDEDEAYEGVKNGDVGEPMLPPDSVEEEESPELVPV